ncbi:MAG: OadG family protein [Deltaproteobacteria bacterium]|nr:OadG family protein [Deltaproteobacteria bacterium]MCB9478507.1 OadG family protein [Deltaproteobacteria bacterium]
MAPLDRIADAHGWAITVAGVLTVFVTLLVIWVFIEAFARVMRHLHLLRQPEEMSLALPSVAPLPMEPDDWTPPANRAKSNETAAESAHDDAPPAAVAPKASAWSSLTQRLSTRNQPARSIFRPRK